MDREFILRTADQTEFPLVPWPFCSVCSNPLSKRWAAINWRCWFCHERLRQLFPHGVPRARGRGRRPISSYAFLSPYSFKQAAAVGLYVSDAPDKGEFGKRVLEFKYGGRGASEMGEALDRVLKERYPRISFDLVVPIPTDGENERNAPRELARALIGRRACPMVPALSLDSSYHSNKKAAREAKFEATRGHFQVHGESLFEGQRVLLVDDVMTTGGHAHWAALALLERGAAVVNVAVLARTFDLRSLRAIRYKGRF